MMDNIRPTRVEHANDRGIVTHDQAKRGPKRLTDDVCILVVEDEVLIADLVVAGLEEAGYAVSVAQNAEGGIALIEAGDAKLRAVVTDINLTDNGLTGWDVAKRARELTPDLPVVYMSGASVSEWTSNGVPNSVIIAKPFAIGQIVTAVSQLLNAASAIAPDQPPPG